MVDLGGLGEAFILGEKVGFKCQRHTESVKGVLWKCYMKFALLFFFWNGIVRRLGETV